MTRALLVALLTLIALPVAAANHRFSSVARSVSHPVKPIHAFWLCDTEAGMPTEGIAEGDLGYAKDTNGWFFWDGASWSALSQGPGGGAPTNAPYIVQTQNASLSQERVLTDSATITWDFSTPGQVSATAQGGSGLTHAQVMARASIGF